MIQIYLISILVIMSIVGDFKSAQLTYSRVRTAYLEKEELISNRLKEKGLKIDGLEIFIRAFKEERILEVWAKNKDQKVFTLFKEYPFCTSSGSLGPKRQEGDLQIPEGFYHLDRFNPQSQYHLSLGINYPNEADRILGSKNKLGGDIFIHGDCVTIGCIPITDQKIKEVYLLAVEARDQGQLKIPVHIFPAKLGSKTMENLKKRYASKPGLLAFWSELQKGYLYFENHKKMPLISIQGNGRYKIDRSRPQLGKILTPAIKPLILHS